MRHPAPVHDKREQPYALLAELALSLLVAAGLLLWALDLPPGGLGGRYPVSTVPGLEGWPFSSPTDPKVRAAWLRWAAPGWLPVWVVLGGLALALGRSGNPGSGLLSLLLAMGLALWMGVDFPLVGALIGNMSPGAGQSVRWGAALGLSLLLHGALTAIRRKLPLGAEAQGIAPRRLSQALLWPIFALLSGMAWLAIADFAAYADPLAAEHGVGAASGMSYALIALVLAAANRPWLAAAWLLVAEKMSRMAHPASPRNLRLWGLAMASLLFAVILGWLGRPEKLSALPLLGRGGGLSHVTGEILRLAAVLVLSWMVYRLGEWGGGSRRHRNGLMYPGLLVILAAACGLVLSSDNGPGMSLALLAAGITGLWPLKCLMARQRPWFALLLAPALMLLLALGFRYLLTEVAPMLSERAAARKAMLQDPALARQSDLFRLQWLMADAPRGGFGPGQTPWCGAEAHSGEQACEPRASRRLGAPLQTDTDFAFALWAAYYGLPVASLSVVLLMVWLTALVLAAVPNQWSKPGVFPPHLMADYALFWAIALAALALLAQTLIALGGILRWSPLSGVPLPLLAYAKTSLVLAAIWLGLVQGPPSVVKSEPRANG